jgi:CRISPR/Cas system-associated exonuclease Cas4 (RecB family)
LLIELVREGLVTLSKQQKREWWSPEEQEEDEKPRAPMGLSELDTCVRRLWYKKHQPEPSNRINPDLHIVWWIGHFIENVIVKALAAAGLPVRERQREFYWMDVPGHNDGIICTDDHPLLAEELGPGRKFLLELKSTKQKKIKDAKRKGIRDAFPGYFMQVQAYMIAWELTFGEQLDGAILFMANKAVDFVKGESPDAYYEELIPRDSLNAQAQMQYIQDRLAEPEVPDRPFVKPDPLCHFCPFAKKCWAGTVYEEELSDVEDLLPAPDLAA